MTWGVALAAAGVAVSAAGAYTGYQGQRNAAKAGIMQARLQREQATTALRTTALQTREAEADRNRRSDHIRGQARAIAALAGIEPDSGSLAALMGEGERMATYDITDIRLLGAARARQYALTGRAAELEGEFYNASGRNAWIRPTLSLLGSGVQAYRSGAFDSLWSDTGSADTQTGGR